MAGPNYIHVRDSDNIVVAVYADSTTPDAGVTEYFETHPIFVPHWLITEWERTAPNTYQDNGVDPNPEPDTDAIVSVSANDETSDFLDTKLVAGTGVTLTELNDGSDETLEIKFDGSTATGMASGVLVGCWHNADDDDDDDEDKDFSWADFKCAGQELVMAKAGEIVCFSISMDKSRTSGSIDFGVTINGIAQNGAGQVITIDGTNPQYNLLVIGTPISYSAGDRIFSFTDSTSFSPSSNDGMFSAWFRDT